MTAKWGAVTPAEAPYLAALGALVADLRHEHSLSQGQLGNSAGVGGKHVANIERGRRRTRRATLLRIVGAVVPPEQVDERLAEMVEAAGPALAADQDEAGLTRTATRLWRWERRMQREQQTAADAASTARRRERRERHKRRVLLGQVTAANLGMVALLLDARPSDNPTVVELRRRLLEGARDDSRKLAGGKAPVPVVLTPAQQAVQTYAATLPPNPTPTQLCRLADLRWVADCEELI